MASKLVKSTDRSVLDHLSVQCDNVEVKTKD